MAPDPSRLPLETTKMRAKAEEKTVEATGPRSEEPPVYVGVAADAVFNTAELIEKILLDVPFRTLLTSQRVSKQWKDAIAGSKEIQEKLFLRPAKAKGAFRKFSYLLDRHELGDLFDVIFGPYGRDSAVEHIPFESVDRSKSFALQASLNPLFQNSLEVMGLPWDRAEDGEQVALNNIALVNHIAKTEKKDMPTLLGKVKSSYLDMFLSQPPAEAVELCCGDRSRTIRSNEGIRIRHIVAACLEIKMSMQEEGIEKKKIVDYFRPGSGRFYIDFPGILHNQELGPAFLFCSKTGFGVEDPRSKKGVIYDD
ncbi:hypothetical protein PRZ48_003844 [Zasmidium cellare]|uniref:F-box domain-containing protein n=1 Tax=Zasmidium cellare TaxID=395010 RepID=A0ABR0EW77_ZASCE|nr:hypothetical protein PRZ48_003844 [Zasmidium cellare]